MAKYHFSVSTMYVGSEISEEIEIPDKVIEDLTESELEEFIEEQYDEWLWEKLNCKWERVQ